MKKNIVRILLAVLTLFFGACVAPENALIRIKVGGGGSGGYAGQPQVGQQVPQSGWLRTDREVGQDLHHKDVSIEVGSHELSQEEKIALQQVLIVKAKTYSSKSHKAPTKNQVMDWGREVEKRSFDVRLTDKETGKPIYQPYTTPKVVRQTWVPAEKVPENIRKQYRVLPPTYGGQ